MKDALELILKKQENKMLAQVALFNKSAHQELPKKNCRKINKKFKINYSKLSTKYWSSVEREVLENLQYQHKCQYILLFKDLQLDY